MSRTPRHCRTAAATTLPRFATTLMPRHTPPRDSLIAMPRRHCYGATATARFHTHSQPVTRLLGYATLIIPMNTASQISHLRCASHDEAACTLIA